MKPINKNIYINKRGLRFKGVRPGSDSMNNDVSKIFEKAGKDYGFEEVQVEFAAFRDLKLNWTKNYKWISFEVADYLKNAPDEIIASFADSIFKGICDGGKLVYSEEVRDWLNSEQFVEDNQATFLRRYRELSESSRGCVRDLIESYNRLISAGLVKMDPQVVFRWYDFRNHSTAYCSVLMKVVVVHSMLDNEDVPEEVLDFVLYSALKRIEAGFKPKDPHVDLSGFPEHDRIEQYLCGRGWSL